MVTSNSRGWPVEGQPGEGAGCGAATNPKRKGGFFLFLEAVVRDPYRFRLIGDEVTDRPERGEQEKR